MNSKDSELVKAGTEVWLGRWREKEWRTLS